MSEFRFKRFSVRQDGSALKVGTDAVLLGATMTVLPSDRRMLDIGAGTGVIALMAAQRSAPECLVEAVEIDGPSVSDASLNFSSSPWSERLRVRQIALQDFAPEAAYDLIFSNPPYYDGSLVNPDAREAAARHCGSLTLNEICAFAAGNLRPRGRLALILPSEEETRLMRTAASFGLFPFRIVRIKTTEKKGPKRLIAEFSRSREEVSETTLTLQEGSGRSAQYSSLTEEFYL